MRADAKPPRRRLPLIAAIAAGLVAIYTLAYVVVSRRGYALADQYGLAGFYYVSPENTDSWRASNRACEVFFCPANAIDRWIGLGRTPASEPIFTID
jgi:hypothetical protein